MMDGDMFVVEELDYSMLVAKWYRFWVKKWNGFVEVKMIEEYKPNDPMVDYDMMETVFDAEDHNMKSGRVGLTTRGTKGAYFDKLYIEPIICEKLDEMKN